jgi:hypothetical protein
MGVSRELGAPFIQLGCDGIDHLQNIELLEAVGIEPVVANDLVHAMSHEPEIDVEHCKGPVEVKHEGPHPSEHGLSLASSRHSRRPLPLRSPLAQGLYGIVP